MSLQKRNHRRIITLGVLSVMAIPIAFLFVFQASSLQIQERSVSLSTAIPSAVATHTYTFNVPSTAVVGSLSFLFCTNSPIVIDPCTAPVEFDVTTAVLQSQTTNTGFSISALDSSANQLVITRSPAANIVGNSSYVFSNIANPSTPNQTVFVRITSHASTDASGAIEDEGTIAFSTAIVGFGVGAFVPPYLTFCVGQTVALNCSVLGTSLANFGELRPTAAAGATIQFSVATNDFSGYSVYMAGQTLTAGNAIIPAMAAAGGSNVGTSQFGSNLRGNGNPAVGADVSGPGSGLVDANYNTPNVFRFVSGDRIAYSPISSDYSRFTISYITNVSEDQPAGLYATTLTYSAVATF